MELQFVLKLGQLLGLLPPIVAEPIPFQNSSSKVAWLQVHATTPKYGSLNIFLRLCWVVQKKNRQSCSTLFSGQTTSAWTFNVLHTRLISYINITKAQLTRSRLTRRDLVTNVLKIHPLDSLNTFDRKKPGSSFS